MIAICFSMWSTVAMTGTEALKNSLDTDKLRGREEKNGEDIEN